MLAFKIAFLSPLLRQFTCVQIAYLNIVILGMSSVWGSPMLIKLRDVAQSPLSRPITDSEGAWLISILPLTGFVVPFFTGMLNDRLGRKMTILLAYIPRITACLLIVFGREYWMLLLGRAISGAADFFCLSSISIYVSEISDKRIRGQSGTMLQINSATGMLIMLGLGPFVSYMTINVLMLCLVVASMLPVMFLIPESPFFLNCKGKKEESIKVLTFLHGSEELALKEYEEYTNKDTEEVVSLWVYVKDKIVVKSFIMIFILSVGQQFSGYNAVNMYLQTIFQSANTTVSSEISSLIIGVIQLFACSCTFFLTNRFKRKVLLITTTAAMLIGMVGLGVFFTIMDNGIEITGFLNYLPLISTGIVIYGYNAGLGSLFWILMAELLYAPVRATGMSLAILFSALSIFLLSFFFPLLTNVIGAGWTYWIFSSVCAFLCVYIAVFVPETHGKSYAEIQAALGRKDTQDIGDFIAKDNV